MAVSGKRPAPVPAPPKGDRPGASAHLRMDAEAAILDLIGQVYDAALDEKLWRELAPSIARTFDSTSAQVHVWHETDGRPARVERLPLTALVAPFRPARDGFGAPIPAAIVFLRDPEGPSPKNIALQGLFGLTSAEATVAAGLVNGTGVDGLAARLGISLNTAKTHLKNIFAKTNTNRQAQLVALILASVAILLDG